MDARSGALDMPGTTWRDRPAVDRGDGVFLAGDMVAAPGLLAEVSLGERDRGQPAGAGGGAHRQAAAAPGRLSAVGRLVRSADPGGNGSRPAEGLAASASAWTFVTNDGGAISR